MKEKLAISVSSSQDKEFNLSKFSRFSGGGDVTLLVSHGPIVSGGTAIDEDEIAPLKGDVATTTNKFPVKTQTYADHKSQVFANIHLTASKALSLALLKWDVQPNEVKRMISYGTILKTGSVV